MTILEALQSKIEYENDNRLTKALLDRGCTTPTATYSTSDMRVVDLAAADVFMDLATHPDFREGSKYIAYKPSALIAIAQRIYNKWGVAPVVVTAPLDSMGYKPW